jgi:DNA polymerase IV
MDAFYASVEQRDDPSLKGKPVVVAWQGQRSVVCAASYEARKFGVRSAMPAIRAERLCPNAVFVPPDFSRYKSVSRQIREIFSRYTDLIEPLSLDEAYLDVTNTKGDFPSATAVAELIRASIREEVSLTASAGIAPNKFLAKIASDWRKPDGLFVIKPNQVQGFLVPLPVAKLPGVGKVMERRLSELGVTTVGQLRSMAQADLEGRFGRWGHRLYELSRGIDNNPVVSERPTMQISSEDTFVEDLCLEEIEPYIRVLSEKTWNAYKKEQFRVARTVVLKLKTSSFQTLTRSVTPPKPPTSAEELANIACALRERVGHDASIRYRLVGVGLAGFVERDSFYTQSDLFSSVAPSSADALR